MDVIESHDKIYQYIIYKYPDLKREAIYFRIRPIISIFWLLLNTTARTQHREEYKVLHSYIYSKLFIILFNKYFGYKVKMKLVLVFFKLYKKAKQNNNYSSSKIML